MRIAVTIVIDLTDAQVADYADHAGIPQQATGHFRARDIVEDVRGYVRNCIQDSAAFGDGAADISIKR